VNLELRVRFCLKSTTSYDSVLVVASASGNHASSIDFTQGTSP
jgi:hypothetical protein